ncbi:MAG TPA: ornithine cyclodeaminase family protein [Solirubrobacteraceae bacterium]|nr:ornithine cyclodeaminase family protein [Solirubrobacteraceae bacterium]
MLILGHDDVLAALSPEECAEAMASVLAAHARGEALMPLRSVFPFEGAAGFMGLMPAWRGGEDPVFSLKSLCVMPGNPARGLDSHQGTVTLFDGSTGVPTAILDASAVTSVRTAAVSTVATGLLARGDARVLAVLGAGVQGRAHLKALARVRAFDEVRVYAPSPEHARAVADGAATVASSAEEAVRGADVVVLATSSREPVISRDWLAPGAHVNAVGASMPSARELDVETVAASALFCDSRESLRNEAGEFRLALEQGAIAGEDHVRAELGEVLAGLAPGRLRDDEVTVFRSLGLAVEDLAAAERAVARARALGLGVEVDP